MGVGHSADTSRIAKESGFAIELEGEMGSKKGTLKQIADAVEAIAVEVGLSSESESKLAREKLPNVARKKAIARVEKKLQEKTHARASALARRSVLNGRTLAS